MHGTAGTSGFVVRLNSKLLATSEKVSVARGVACALSTGVLRKRGVHVEVAEERLSQRVAIHADFALLADLRAKLRLGCVGDLELRVNLQIGCVGDLELCRRSFARERCAGV